MQQVNGTDKHWGLPGSSTAMPKRHLAAAAIPVASDTNLLTPTGHLAAQRTVSASTKDTKAQGAEAGHDPAVQRARPVLTSFQIYTFVVELKPRLK